MVHQKRGILFLFFVFIAITGLLKADDATAPAAPTAAPKTVKTKGDPVLKAAMKAAAQLADQGKTDEAVAAYEKIGVLKNPKSESWRLNSEGVAYLNAPQAQPEKSVSLFEKAVEADPDNILAYNNLGLAYEGTKQWDKAKDAFQKAVDASQAAHLSPARYQANLKLLQISMDEMADKKADEKTTAAANASVSVTPSTTVK